MGETSIDPTTRGAGPTENTLDPIRNSGTIRPRDSRSDSEDASPRRTRARTDAGQDDAMPLSPRRAGPGHAGAGPSGAAPRVHLPQRPSSSAPAGSLGGFPRPAWVDLNAAAPTSPRPRPFDLNAAAPASPRPRPFDFNDAPAEGARPAAPAAQAPDPDMPAPAAAILAHFGIHGRPQEADVIRLLETLTEHTPPVAEDLVLRACEEMLVQIGRTEELLQALDIRFSRSPTMSRAINRLMDHILSMEEFSDVSSSHSADESDGLQDDLEQQAAPLSDELRRWNPSLATADFDNEPNARPFARMLSRLLQQRDEGSSSSAAEQLTMQVSSVIRAIASDPELRAEVFLIAETALGSCTDNLAEGFSNVLLAVNNHQMRQAVERGDVSEAQLHRWAGQQLRLSLLEGAVNRFIADTLARPGISRTQRENLQQEPLETMVHAKVALRERLDLPESTMSSMTFRTCSVLTQAHLDALAKEVEAASADPQTRNAYLLGNATWRAGMRAAHPEPFAALARERDEDPFHDLDVPSTVEGQAEYAALARDVEAKWARREDELLLSLAAASEKRP